MKRIASLIFTLIATVSLSFAANDDIELLVKDIVVVWGGGGGSKDVANKSFTYTKYAENYWDIHDLSTDAYERVDFAFARPVGYSKVRVTAVYADGTSTQKVIGNGVSAFNLAFDKGKTLSKIIVSHSWDEPSEQVTLYFDSVIIRAKESTGIVSGMPVKSPKLGTGMANPLLDFMFCADPTAIEHDGRLYVYGTNDHQQYEAATETNTYDKIKTLTIMSTDDMANWTYHGLISVADAAPWIQASWAPSIISKQQPDGSTLFSLYFSNSGWGTAVIQAKSPVGPWTSPLGKSLIDGSNPTVAGSGSIFDPGAVIDDNGDAWLTFGASQGWIAKLAPDLHSFASTPVKLNTPYHFEANEMNYINGQYVYTYNTDWSEHTPWAEGGNVPSPCSMIYMTSTDPLNPASWKYGDCYFKNPGANGMNYSNNHTHLQKYKGKWYLFYHTTHLQPSLTTDGGYRSIYVDEIEVDEPRVAIKECIPTHQGVTAIKNLDTSAKQYAATAAATLGILYKPTAEAGHMVATVGTTSITAPTPDEGIIEVRNAEFSADGDTFACRVKGNGSVAVRLDDRNGPDLASIDTASDDWADATAALTSKPAGVHTIYLILKGGAQLDTWQITDSSANSIGSVLIDAPTDNTIYDLQGRRLATTHAPHGIYIINGEKHLIK